MVPDAVFGERYFRIKRAAQYLTCLLYTSLDIEGFRQNPKNRCYLCKHELFEKILEIAKEYHINAVAEGSNMDDNGDYRPGLVAVAELGIKSPLREALLNKEEIRTLSKEMGLPTWDTQSFACLSSRFVYGETISEEKLGLEMCIRDRFPAFTAGAGISAESPEFRACASSTHP